MTTCLSDNAGDGSNGRWSSEAYESGHIRLPRLQHDDQYGVKELVERPERKRL